jgi:serpin B
MTDAGAGPQPATTWPTPGILTRRDSMTLIAPALAIATLANVPEVRAMASVDPPAELVRGNNAFALDLYSRLRSGDGNRFLSPWSISAALAMTYAGARGPTAAEMAKVLHFDTGPAQLHEGFHLLITELHGRNTPRAGSNDDPDVQLLTANALWAQAGYRLLPEFLKLIEVNYGGGLYTVDFQGATEAARQRINAWVEEQTRDKIKELLKPGILGPLTRLVLTNAIYFKALWAAPFAAANTHPDDFQVSKQDKVRVAMMNQTASFGYLDGGPFQALELPYKGNTLAMVIVLPKSVDGLAALESAMTLETLDTLLKPLSPRRVRVSLPKFKLTGEFKLNQVLSDLGMPSAFESSADFSGMTGTRDLAISAVVHKAFVAVEEKGTEAAAATAVVMGRAVMHVPPPTVFRADHPFVFLIRDVRTGSILFLGRLVRPEA